MSDVFPMYLVGVAHSVICVTTETMRQIERGNMQVRELAVHRAVSRVLLDLVVTMPPSRDRAFIVTRDALLVQLTAYDAYLGLLAECDSDTAKQKRADYAEAQPQLTSALATLNRSEHRSD